MPLCRVPPSLLGSIVSAVLTQCCYPFSQQCVLSSCAGTARGRAVRVVEGRLAPRAVMALPPCWLGRLLVGRDGVVSCSRGGRCHHAACRRDTVTRLRPPPPRPAGGGSGPGAALQLSGGSGPETSPDCRAAQRALLLLAGGGPDKRQRSRVRLGAGDNGVVALRFRHCEALRSYRN